MFIEMNIKAHSHGSDGFQAGSLYNNSDSTCVEWGLEAKWKCAHKMSVKNIFLCLSGNPALGEWTNVPLHRGCSLFYSYMLKKGSWNNEMLCCVIYCNRCYFSCLWAGRFHSSVGVPPKNLHSDQNPESFRFRENEVVFM